MESTRKRLLVVDDEVDLLRSLEQRFRTALPNYDVLGVTNATAALEHIRAHEQALVVTDVRMPGLTGLELLLHARERWPSLPFVVMTAFPTEHVKREAMSLGVHYIEKPFAFPALLTAVREILDRQANPGFSGAVSSATLPDLIQLFFMSGSTGALRVWHDSGEGAIFFDRGAIVHAAAGELPGRKAVFEMVSWAGGKFAMDLNVPPPARTVQESTTSLVLEALRRADERNSGRTALTNDLEEVEILEGDYIDLAEGLAIDPTPSAEGPAQSASSEKRTQTQAETRTETRPRPSTQARPPAASATAQPLSAVAPTPAEAQNEIPMNTKGKGESMSNNVHGVLERLRTIDGYIGACIVDAESSMSLGSDGGGAMLNLEVAAAGNSEVVKAKRKAMRALGLKDEIEDILITLGKQYHLIRPLRGRPGVFIYLALERSRANLAMSRMVLADAEKLIEL